jgi:hypothetical protein
MRKKGVQKPKMREKGITEVKMKAIDPQNFFAYESLNPGLY